MSQKTYTVFKPGDVVTVIPEEQRTWTFGLDNPVTRFTVARVSAARCPHCTGHIQHLHMTDGTVASGAWFDPNTPANRKIKPYGCCSDPPAPWHIEDDFTDDDAYWSDIEEEEE